MASDVDATIHQIIEQQGQKTPEEAKAYVNELKQQNVTNVTFINGIQQKLPRKPSLMKEFISLLASKPSCMPIH